MYILRIGVPTMRVPQYAPTSQEYDLNKVPQGVPGSPKLSPFWPYKLAGMLVYGEVHGVKKLPGHVLVVPFPVLHRLCPIRSVDLKGHCKMAVELGLWASVEFHYNTMIVVVNQTPWETGMLDVSGTLGGSGIITHPPALEDSATIAQQLALDDDYYDPAPANTEPLEFLTPQYQANLLK